MDFLHGSATGRHPHVGCLREAARRRHGFLELCSAEIFADQRKIYTEISRSFPPPNMGELRK